MWTPLREIDYSHTAINNNAQLQAVCDERVPDDCKLRRQTFTFICKDLRTLKPQENEDGIWTKEEMVIALSI